MRYWFPLLPLTTLLLYGLHLVTGKTPAPIWFGAEGLPIYGAAVLLVTAVIFGYLVVAILTADRAGSHPHLLAMLASILFWGLIGARLYHVLAPAPSNPFPTADYLANPWLILSLRSGGLGFYGALLGGGLALGIYCWRHKLPVLVWGDAAVIGLALGQAIGRWGNFFNQELYGTPTNLPWAVHISPDYRLPGLEEIATYHPAFLYESLWCLGLFGLLWWLHGRPAHRAGDGVLVYLGGYALGRLLIEAVRLDVPTAVVAGISLPVATWVSLALLMGVLVYGCIRLFYGRVSS